MSVYLRVMASVLVCAMASASTGCTTMKTIRPASPGAPVFGKVKAGDTVSVQTHDGRSMRFVVQRVDGENLVAADGTHFAPTDIARLQRRSFSAGKTGALAAGLIAAAFLALVAAVAASPVPWY